MELRGHYTHSSPCSPSRATLLTGQHVPEHGVTDNVFVDPVQPDLHTATPTIGHVFRAAGYRTAYLGKWHLSYGNPDIERYGFSDWTGEDWAWTGLAGTGAHYDEIIAAQAADWLGAHGDERRAVVARRRAREPARRRVVPRGPARLPGGACRPHRDGLAHAADADPGRGADPDLR